MTSYSLQLYIGSFIKECCNKKAGVEVRFRPDYLSFNVQSKDGEFQDWNVTFASVEAMISPAFGGSFDAIRIMKIFEKENRK